jgi:hypothetical protein
MDSTASGSSANGRTAVTRSTPVKRLAYWVLYVVLVAGLNSGFVLAQRSIFASGDSALFGLTFLLEWLLGIMTLALPVLLVAMLFREWRKRAIRPFLAALVYVVIGYTCAILAIEARRSAFHDLTESSRPLIRAIHRFEETNGHPPANLEQLVPDYLSTIPNTAPDVYPSYRYFSGKDGNGKRVEELHHGNPWVVHIVVPDWLTNWRAVTYYPLQNYSEYPREHRFGQIGDWIVVDGPLTQP